MEVCQKSWYKCHDTKISIFYNYRNLFLNDDGRAMHGNNGLKKPR